MFVVKNLDKSIDYAHRQGFSSRRGNKNWPMNDVVLHYWVGKKEDDETNKDALRYFERARRLYEYWGSTVKVQQITMLIRNVSSDG